jgi:hypothetical protein
MRFHAWRLTIVMRFDGLPRKITVFVVPAFLAYDKTKTVFAGVGFSEKRVRFL